MNLSTLTQFAALLAGDQQQSRYSGLYTTALNEAQVQFALDTRVLFKDFIFSIVAGTSAYTLPSDFMYEYKLVISEDVSNPLAAGITLTPITRKQLEFSTVDHNWQDDTGTPKFYIIDPASSSGVANSVILYPQPQGADAGTNNAFLTYYPYPVPMVNNTDVPLNGTNNLQQFHIGIAAYAAWLLMGAEVATQETIAKMDKLYKQYQGKVTEAIDKYGTSKSASLRMVGGRIFH